MKYYAIHQGREIGVFNTWKECDIRVYKYHNASFKRFNNRADAEEFVKYGEITHHTKIIHRSDSLNEIQDNVITKSPHLIELTDSCESDIIFIYTDGSCRNNGAHNALAGIGIYFGKNDIRNLSSQITGKGTNNILGTSNANSGASGGSQAHNHGFTGAAHTHTWSGSSAAVNVDVQYVDVIIATKS